MRIRVALDWLYNSLQRQLRLSVSLVTAGLFLFGVTAQAQNGAYDLSGDGNVDSADVQLAVEMALGTTVCANSLGVNCDVVLVQQVINAATVGRVRLDWSPSPSPNVAGYNAYRATTPGGPYLRLNSSLLTGTSYTDEMAQRGQTYYYVATAVGTNQLESARSPEASATVPGP